MLPQIVPMAMSPSDAHSFGQIKLQSLGRYHDPNQLTNFTWEQNAWSNECDCTKLISAYLPSRQPVTREDLEQAARYGNMYNQPTVASRPSGTTGARVSQAHQYAGKCMHNNAQYLI